MRAFVVTAQLCRSAEETETLRNTFANRSHYEYLFDEDVLIVGPDGIIARLVTGCLSPNLVEETAKYFRTVRADVSARGSVVGKDSMMNRLRADDSLSHTKGVPYSIVRQMRANHTFSDFLGWDHKTVRFPFCRETAWSLNSPDVHAAAVPFMQAVDRVYRAELPDHYARQHAFIERVSPKFKFHGTGFTTCTVNRNLRTAYHEDANDFRGGMGNLVVLDSNGSGPLVMPRYRLALLPSPGDVLLMNVHELHGNGIFTGERLTAVLYARERMDQCEQDSTRE